MQDNVAPRHAAFFDVDGTLITVQSMFRFLAYDLAARGRPPAAYQDALAALRAAKATGAPRAQTNRMFYGNFAGRNEAELAARGAAWFRVEYQRGGLFNEQVLAVLSQHARAGVPTVLVSGSFPPCLDPIVDSVGADLPLCSRPEVRAGHYTGKLATPMVDTQKAEAVRTEAATRGIVLEHSYAYADHASDPAAARGGRTSRRHRRRPHTGRKCKPARVAAVADCRAGRELDR